MNKEFVIRGQTASGLNEVLNFSGHTPGFAYRITEFAIYPSEMEIDGDYELFATVTAAKTAEDAVHPNFNNEGLLGSTMFRLDRSFTGPYSSTVVNDLFLITQDLILTVIDTKTGGTGPQAVNWQCRFIGEKLSTSEEAVTNYKQFTISNDD